LHQAAVGGEASSRWVPHVTAREIDVLLLIAQGLSNGEIAERLFVSPETVKTHVKTVLEKLHARTRAHAVAVALRRGLID
jgi:DNA-binding CsgD family transcriptional regulator